MLDGSVINPLRIFFNSVQTNADVAVITNPGTSLFEALLNGAVVDSFSAGTSTTMTSDFYGFSGESFNQIEIFAGGSNNAIEIDNIQFNAASVPEPGTL